MTKKLLIFLILLLAGSIVLVAYFNEPSFKAKLNQVFSTAPDESKLQPRVLSRWKAMKAHDLSQVYEYFSPTYRKLFSLNQYSNSVGTTVEWVSIKVNKIQVKDSRAEVTLIVDFRLHLPLGAGLDFGDETGKISKIENEVWLWDNGEWWIVNQTSGHL